MEVYECVNCHFSWSVQGPIGPDCYCVKCKSLYVFWLTHSLIQELNFDIMKEHEQGLKLNNQFALQENYVSKY